MEFSKCGRCGNFYVAQGNVCPECSSKDSFEFGAFKSYIQENGFENSLDNISTELGVSVKNLNRFLGYEGFEDYKKDNKFGNQAGSIGNDGIFFNC